RHRSLIIFSELIISGFEIDVNEYFQIDDEILRPHAAEFLGYLHATNLCELARAKNFRPPQRWRMLARLRGFRFFDYWEYAKRRESNATGEPMRPHAFPLPATKPMYRLRAAIIFTSLSSSRTSAKDRLHPSSQSLRIPRSQEDRAPRIALTPSPRSAC